MRAYCAHGPAIFLECESTCALKHSIEMRDRKIAVLCEKIHHQYLLFDSIKKETVCIKQVVDRKHWLVSEKEQSAILKRKVDDICYSKKTLKMFYLDQDYLQKDISVKEETIQSLVTEKQALLLEIQNLELILQKIQETASAKFTVDQGVLLSALQVKVIDHEINSKQPDRSRIRLDEKIQEDDASLVYKHLERGRVCFFCARA
ncbi:hypothetical protein AMTRI_Chr13g121770 [Amborella trichopoda]